MPRKLPRQVAKLDN